MRDALRPLLAALAAANLAGCGRQADRPPPLAGTEQAPPARVEEAAARFRCVGNEPGWSLEIRADSLVFVGDYGEIRASFPGVTPRTGEGLWYWESETRSVPSGFARIAAVVTRDSCSDGMSDRAYGYRARVLVDTKGYVGCAERR